MSNPPVANLDPADRILIDDLLARYSRAFDHADLDAFLDVFVEDGVFDSEMTGTFTGKAQLTEFFNDLNNNPDYPLRRDGQHWITNLIFTEVEEDRVEMWSSFMFLIAPDGEVRVSVMGEYDDTFVKRDGRWLFARRGIRVSGDREAKLAPAFKK